jgi:hypothetical protein
MKTFSTSIIAGATVLLFAGAAQAVNVVPNSTFESGLNDWIQVNNNGTIGLAADNGPSAPGIQSAQLSADGSAGASFPLIKVERLAEGLLIDGAAVTVSYDAKATLQTVDFPNTAGAVVFIAELLTEREGDNGASNEILQGPPNFLTDQWQTYTFNTVLGPDAGGGVSLLFKADCGAAPNCRLTALIDNVTIDTTVVPVPAAVWLFGSALGLLGWVRRKAA